MPILTTLLLQTAVQRDTVVTVPARDAVDLALALAAISVALTFGALLVAIVLALLGVRKGIRATRDLTRKVSVDPAVRHLRRTSENVESISETLREEVSRLSVSVSRISERLDQASDRMEERIEDFNALMEVVQQEAEGAFVDGASTARGVRSGLGKLAEDRRHRPSSASSGEVAPNRDRSSKEDLRSAPLDAHPKDSVFDDEIPLDPDEQGS